MDDLKQVLYKLYLEAGAPSLDKIKVEVDLLTGELGAQMRREGQDDDQAEAAVDALIGGSPKRDTISRIIGSEQLPPDKQDVVAVAVALSRMDGHLLDHSVHRDLPALVRQVRDLWVRAYTAPPPPRLGRPISACTALELEVHRAVEVPGHGQPLPLLPPYVTRTHDARLRAVVAAAAAGASRMVMLVGGSSTGKTRACWEAIQALPERWRLWHPFDPSRPEAATAALAEVGPHTVVWLNEAQHYLLPTDPRLGERIVAGLRTLLTDSDRSPVLIVGTIWPRYWRPLTASPEAGNLDPRDPHAQARELLAMSTGIFVPDAFTPADLQTLAAIADGDPRLRHAADHAAADRVTQQLAGVPELVRRYRTGTSVAKAAIQAAMDLRRLGHPAPIPYAFMTQAVPGYLDPTTWSTHGGTWPSPLDDALEDLGEPAHGILGPLAPIHPLPGDTPTAGGPWYRLADYLDQTGRSERAGICPPDSLWTTCTTTAADPDLLLQLGKQAEDRGRFQHAIRLYIQAADRGDIDAGRALVRLREQAGAAAADVLDRLARRFKGAAGVEYVGGAVEQALDRQADDRIRLGTSALHDLAAQRQQAGDAAAAEASYREAADRGDTGALCALARLREQAGDAEGARAWAVQAAECGDTSALDDLAGRREAAGNSVDAEALAVLAADYGNTETLWLLAWLRDQSGDAEAAEALAVQIADRSGNAGVLSALACMRELAGDTDSAEALHRQAADRGRTGSMRDLARLRHRAGDVDGADALYRQAIDCGDADALQELAELRQAVGDSVSAGRLLQFGLTGDGKVATMSDFAFDGGLVSGTGLDGSGRST